MYQRIKPALEESTKAWTTLRDQVSDIAVGATLTPPAFEDAARKHHEALVNTHLNSEPRDQKEILATMSGHAATSASIGVTARDLIRDRDLVGPAQALSKMVRESTREDAEIDPLAIFQRTSVPLPNGARDLLLESAQRAVDASTAVMDGTAAFDSLYRNPVGASTPRSPTPAIGRTAERVAMGGSARSAIVP